MARIENLTREELDRMSWSELDDLTVEYLSEHALEYFDVLDLAWKMSPGQMARWEHESYLEEAIAEERMYTTEDFAKRVAWAMEHGTPEERALAAKAAVEYVHKMAEYERRGM